MNRWIQQWGVRVVEEPTDEQINLEEAWLHLRLTPEGSPAEHIDDPLIAVLITTAREVCEGLTGRALAPQTLELTLDGFPCAAPTYFHRHSAFPHDIVLPMGPVTSIESVQYLDAGSLTTLDPTQYAVSTSDPARLYLYTGFSWPTIQYVPGAVSVRYQAGYDLIGDSPEINPLPSSILSAMKLVLGHLYENREQSTDLKLDEIPMGVYALLERYRLRLSMA